MGGELIGFGHCYGCGLPFAFDPDRVASVYVDPVTRRPPDVDEHGQRQPIDGAAMARAVRVPICPDCLGLIHVRRREADSG